MLGEDPYKPRVIRLRWRGSSHCSPLADRRKISKRPGDRFFFFFYARRKQIFVVITKKLVEHHLLDFTRVLDGVISLNELFIVLFYHFLRRLANVFFFFFVLTRLDFKKPETRPTLMFIKNKRKCLRACVSGVRPNLYMPPGGL